MSGGVRRVVATVPVRVADVGGWTDTWFGAPGRVCPLAVGPGVRVAAELGERPAGGAPVVLGLPDLGQRRAVVPAAPTDLLEHAVAEAAERAGELADDRQVVVTVQAAVPPGASLGTSAAVLVGVLAALDAVLGAEPSTPEELAVRAHRVETERAGRQAGVQDEWAAAFGGAALLHVAPYPEVRREPVVLAEATAEALGRDLVTVVFGPHDSSTVHQAVIDSMIACGGATHDRARRGFARLASLATDAAAALADGDLARWGEVLTAATDGQAELHPDLVGPAHRAAIERAETHGARGWKVNGAGGAGGSLTVLAAEGRGTELRAALAAVDPTWQVVELTPAAGVQVDVEPTPSGPVRGRDRPA